MNLPKSFVGVFFCISFGFWCHAATHPLTPPSRDELELAVKILKQFKKADEKSLFPVIALKEPVKNKVQNWNEKSSVSREIFAIVFEREKNITKEYVVDLGESKIVSEKILKNVQPSIMPEELNLVPEIVRVDKRWQEAIKKRGITRFEDVLIDPWAPGILDKGESRSVRWVRALSYFRGNAVNGYARPIEGLVAVVNMNKKQVEKVLDYGVLPVPPLASDLDEKSIGPQREAPKPLKIVQPNGPSFEVNGQEIKWQKWKFHFSVHPRDGLILYDVSYNDAGKIRPIIYKASLSEMVVPYGDAAKNWTFRNAFDEGEYGIGKLIDSLEAGVEVPENTTFFDVDFMDDLGKHFNVPNAVALYERDGGLLWKHFEFYGSKNEARRARELVLTHIVTVANYDYGFNWIFRQDGSLELQALLTGIMLAKGVPIKSLKELKNPHEAHHWHMVAPYVAAPHHQHFFNFRIDWEVDGTKNTVNELNVQSVPLGKQNPDANALTMTLTPLKKEVQAKRNMSLERSRKWIVVNPNEFNSLGYPTGFGLIPGDNSVPYIQLPSPIRQRARFIDHHIWVTPYKPDENYAAGDYPNQSKPGEGLPKWTRANRPIENTDVVMWYTFGVTHTPRPEEWPVMPATYTGFKLLPVGFFDKSPALDVPKNK